MAAVVSLEDARAARGRREEDWVAKTRVAERFDVKPRTVERWIEKGCPAERLYGDRGPWRFKLSAVQQWLGIGQAAR